MPHFTGGRLSGMIKLTWGQTDNDYDGYKIYKKAENGSWCTLISQLGQETLYDDTNISDSKAYSYKMLPFVYSLDGKKIEMDSSYITFRLYGK